MRLVSSVIIALFVTVSAAHAGPCSAQIAQIQQQINAARVGAAAGPSAPQSVGAQLGRQPTPATVEDAENKASALAEAALARVRKANDDGNAAACSQALNQVKNLYGLP